MEALNVTWQFIVALVGLVAGVIAIYEFIERRSRAAHPAPRPIIDESLIRAAESEDRVLLRYDPKRREEAGTLEHFVSELSKSLTDELRNGFIEYPYGTVRMATLMMAQRRAMRWLIFFVGGSALLIFAMSVVGVFVRFGEMDLQGRLLTPVFVLGSMLVAYIAYRALRQNSKEYADYRAGRDAAQKYVDYLNSRGILMQLEFTQLKSKRDEDLARLSTGP